MDMLCYDMTWHDISIYVPNYCMVVVMVYMRLLCFLTYKVWILGGKGEGGKETLEEA